MDLDSAARAGLEYDSWAPVLHQHVEPLLPPLVRVSGLEFGVQQVPGVRNQESQKNSGSPVDFRKSGNQESVDRVYGLRECDSGVGGCGLGFRVQGLGISDSVDRIGGLRDYCSGFGGCGLGFRVQGLGILDSVDGI